MEYQTLKYNHHGANRRNNIITVQCSYNLSNKIILTESIDSRNRLVEYNTGFYVTKKLKDTDVIALFIE